MSNVQKSIEETPRPRRRPPSFFWPLVLIGAGVVLLFSNLGYIPWSSWNVLWRLWPLLLIALGVDVLIGRRSMGGAIVSGVLILMLIGGAVLLVIFAQNIPALSELAQPAEWHAEYIEHPLGDIESASITIDWSSKPGYLTALEDSTNLIEGDIVYRGDLIFDVDEHGGRADVELDTWHAGFWFSPDFRDWTEGSWDVKLTPELPLDLNLDSGSGSCDFDLTDLQISDLMIDSGSGSIDLSLPSGSTFEGDIDSGSGAVEIILPEGVGMRVVLDSGSGSFRPDDRFQLVSGERDDDGVWETENFDTAEHTIMLEIDQGSGSITIR